MQEEREMIEYENETIKAYDKINIMECNKIEEQKKNYYKESIDALIQYMENHEMNPSEKRWNEYAICKKYLSAKTIGYLSKMGFNTLCRKIRKELNKRKR